MISAFLFLFTFNLSAASTQTAAGLYFQNRYPESLQEYEAVIATDPANTSALLNAAVLYRELGDIKKSLKFLRRAHKLDPEDAEIAETLAWYGYLSGDNALAESTALNIQTPLSYLTQSLIYLEQNRPEEAANAAYKTTLEAPHYAAMGHYLMGEAYAKQGQSQKASESYSQSLRSDYTAMEARLAQAKNMEKAGNKEEAVRHLSKVMHADPKHSSLKGKKEEIKALETATDTAWKENPLVILTGLNTTAAINREQIPSLRIGLGTTPGGRLTQKDGVLFTASGNFRITAKKSGAEIAQGASGEFFSVKVLRLKAGPCLQILRSTSTTGSCLADTLIVDMQSPEAAVILHNVPHGQGFAWGGKADRLYRGKIEFSPHAQYGVQVINEVNLEEYLFSVLASEMLPSWPLEALKAQAVIARTEALHRQKINKPHRNTGYDLCDDQHCQVYAGMSSEKEKTRQAIEATRGEILAYKKRPIHALFHANCGGLIHAAEELAGWWGEPYMEKVLDTDSPPASPWQRELWLRGLPSANCSPSNLVSASSFRWIRRIPTGDLQERVNREYALGKLKNILTLERTSAGYINKLKLVGSTRSVILTREHEIRKFMALGRLRSTLAVFHVNSAPDGTIENIFVFGGGWGHGVGFCQSGAANLAQNANQDHRQILKHYYPKAEMDSVSY